MLAKIFEEQVDKLPDKVAVKTSNGVLTYTELNSNANKAAYKIMAEGIDNLSCNIALLFEHGIDMVVGTIAAIKTGQTYVPLDSSYPQNRLRYMIENSDVKVLVTNRDNYKLAEKLISGLDDIKIINITSISNDTPCNNLDLNIDGGNIAYILYTSGSTGFPKGVMQSYENVYYFIENYVKDLKITNEERITLFSAFSHDAAIMDIYGALLSGASLYPLNVRNQINASELTSWLINEGITIWHSVPTLFRYYTNMISGKEIFEKLRYIVLGGEALLRHDIEMYQQYFKYSILVNLYGQSEASYNSSLFIENSKELKRITLGNIVSKTELLLIDEDGEEADVLMTEEIIVVSKHIALGYWKDKTATDKVFLEIPELGRIYKTGDLGKFLPDGSIEFMGRKDYQIKIRGYRVELGDIESQLLKIAEIKEAVVIGKIGEQEETFLYAFIASDKKFTIGELREFLRKELPDYMIPSYFIQLDKMPMTPNGKIDRKALYNIVLPLSDKGIEIGAEYEAPRNEVEQSLVDIWREVLGVDKIGINDNFFELGGHSLKATSLVAKIHKVLNIEVPLKEIFNTPTIKGILEYIKNSEESIYSSIEPVEEKDYYEMSSAQKRIYILQQLDPNSTSYNMPRVLQLEGDIDREQLKETFNKLIQRHEALRTSFEAVEEGLIQKVYKEVEFEIEEHKVELEGEIEDIVNNFIRAFDLSKAPLLRVGIVKIHINKYILMYDMHHIISDGVSMEILVEEFSRIYSGEELTPIKIQYKDFSEWQNGMFGSGKMKVQEEYWLKQFEGEIPVMNLPIDYQRPAVQSFEGDSIKFQIGKELTSKLRQIAKGTGSTMYIVLLSIFNILLSKYSGQDDIVVGSPIAGRPHADLENIIGMFVNTLAMRNYPSGEKTYKEFLMEVKNNALGAYENQDYQFEELVEKLTIARDFSRNPLFDVMFVLQNMDIGEATVKDIKIRPYKSENRISKFDITIAAVELENSISIVIQYCTKLFSNITIKRMYIHLENIIHAVTKNIDIKLSEVDILTKEERQQILINFNNTKADYPKDKTIHQLFEEQVVRIPGNIAVIYKDKQLTYSELNERANQLARLLRNKGVSRDIIVAMIVERSLEMEIGMLAILKAGGAYLPISPDYPEDRIKYMLEDSGTRVLLTQERFTEKIKFECTINLEDKSIYQGENTNLEYINTSRDIAYVIYTSGSTGKPKGVMIEHYSVTNRINWMQKEYPLNSTDVILQKTPFTFDVSVWELFWWFLAGARVCFLIPGGEKDPEAIISAIEKNKATTIHFVPSMLNIFLDYIDETIEVVRLSSLRQVFASGEALNLRQVEDFNRMLWSINGTKLINLYGPTEATVDVSNFDCSIEKKLELVPIGKPIDNIELYVVNKYNSLMPVGIPGELCIAGVGLARGYLGKPELTAEKFIQNPFKENERMYRTGDLAKWLPDGNIEYLGRRDNQVKLRGYRIELGEIEEALQKHTQIKTAVVLNKAYSSGINYLTAYYVIDKLTLSSQEIKGFLEQSLPDYMIPSYFVQLEELPKTSNGKVDRRAILDSDYLVELRTNSMPDYKAPENNTEEVLVEIWQEVLRVERVGVDDNFFELGGHSLSLISLMVRINKDLGVEIPLKEMIDNPTIKDISNYILKGRFTKKQSEDQLYLLNEKKERNIFAFPPIAGYGIAYKRLAEQIETHSLYVFDFIETEDRIDQYVKEIIKKQNKGPYILLGYSAGANLAYDTAFQLIEMGYEVSNIIVYDAALENKKFKNMKDERVDVKKILDRNIDNLADLKRYDEFNQTLDIKYFRATVERKINIYVGYMRDFTAKESKLKSNIHLIFSDVINKEVQKHIINPWQNAITGKVAIYNGAGKHEDMLKGGDLQQNADLLNGILKNL